MIENLQLQQSNLAFVLLITSYIGCFQLSKFLSKNHFNLSKLKLLNSLSISRLLTFTYLTGLKRCKFTLHFFVVSSSFPQMIISIVSLDYIWRQICLASQCQFFLRWNFWPLDLLHRGDGYICIGVGSGVLGGGLYDGVVERSISLINVWRLRRIHFQNIILFL